MATHNPTIRLETVTLTNSAIYKALAEQTLNDQYFTYFQKRDPLEAIQNHCRTILVLVDNNIAGYYHLDIDSSKTWFGIYIIKKFQGKGFGKLLLKDAQNYAHKEEMDLHVSVSKNNCGAFMMCKKMNFDVISEIDGKILMRWAWNT
jgi:GNAT superfamily N-acetyltransferase